jgi:deazaflavin-dependent oxidoreductase (nitroreductase family)
MAYNRPNKLNQWSNHAIGWLASMGIGPSRMVMLETRGRSSGRPRTTAVNEVTLDGLRYLVSTRGEAEWVRNVRVANSQATIVRRGRKPIRLEEVPVEQRAPIIQAYLKENISQVRAFFAIGPDAPLEEFQHIAPQHPVFQIVEPS